MEVFDFYEAAKSATLTMKEMQDKISELECEKSTQEVTTLQLMEIERCAKNRANYLLRNDMYSEEHYRIFAINLWRELKIDSYIGKRKDMTQMKDFDAVMHDIEEWTPNIGIEELMKKSDRNRRKRNKKRIIATTSDGQKIIIQR